MSLAQKASLAYATRDDPSARPDAGPDRYQAVLLDTIPDHVSPLFQTLTFQLAIWTTSESHCLQQQTVGGLQDRLATCGTLLLHFQREMFNHVPLPWTSAYAILHTAVFSRAVSCLLRLDMICDESGHGSIEGSEALESVPAQLASLSRTFHGLQELCFLYDHIRTAQMSPATVRGHRPKAP